VVRPDGTVSPAPRVAGVCLVRARGDTVIRASPATPDTHLIRCGSDPASPAETPLAPRAVRDSTGGSAVLTARGASEIAG